MVVLLFYGLYAVYDMTAAKVE